MRNDEHFCQVFDGLGLSRFFKNELTDKTLDQFIHGERTVLGIGKATSTFTLREGGRECEVFYSNERDLVYNTDKEFIILKVSETHYREKEGQPFRVPNRTFKSASPIEDQIDLVLDQEATRTITNDGYARHRYTGLHWYCPAFAYVVLDVKAMREVGQSTFTLPVRHVEVAIDGASLDNSQSRYNATVEASKQAFAEVLKALPTLLTVNDSKVSAVKTDATWFGTRYVVLSPYEPRPYYIVARDNVIQQIHSQHSPVKVGVMARIDTYQNDKGETTSKVTQVALDDLATMTHEEVIVKRREVGIFESRSEAQQSMVENEKAHLENRMIESKIVETHSKAEVNTTKATTEVMKEYRGMIGAVIGASLSAGIAILRFIFSASSKAYCATPVGLAAVGIGCAAVATKVIAKPIVRLADRVIVKPIKRAARAVKSFFSNVGRGFCSLFS